MAKPELTEWDEDLTASAEEDYEALVRSLQWAKGFGLLFVQCTPAEGERLMQRVRDDITDKTIDVLRLEGEVDDLYETVAALQEINNTNVLFVTGLEKSLVPYIKPGYGSEGDYYAKDTVPKLLGKLNLQREKFRETLKLCFVFLVPPYAMKYLIRRAADFFDWRSGVWELVPHSEKLRQEVQSFLANGIHEEVTSWPDQQKKQRLLEIDDFVDNPEISESEISNLLCEKGNILATFGLYELAASCYGQASSVNLENFSTLFWQGKTFYHLNRNQDAMDCFDKALRLNPNDPRILNGKGLVLAALNRFEEAIEYYDKAIGICPGNHLFFNKGYALDAIGRLEEAIDNYDIGLLGDPFNENALYCKGSCLSKIGFHDKAVECYSAVLLINPSDFDALVGKANSLSAMGLNVQALSCYDSALLVNPSNAEVLLMRGSILRKTGYLEDAMYDVLNAFDLRRNASMKQKIWGFILRKATIFWYQYSSWWR